jgi:hypothetical protein
MPDDGQAIVAIERVIISPEPKPSQVIDVTPANGKDITPLSPGAAPRLPLDD